MSPIRLREAATGPAGLRESIAALAMSGSIETSTKNLVEIESYASLLPAGTDVYATWLPGMPYHHIVSVAKRLRRSGMNPVPHIAARHLANREVAAEFAARLEDEAGVTRALVIAGDARGTVGPYASSCALIETGLLQAHGIRSLGIAGYPEGHPRIPEPQIMVALDRKIRYARDHGIELFIVSQFCFDGTAVRDWLQRLRARGVTLPVRAGVAGPASLRTLLGYGMRCGIGNSVRALGSHAVSLTSLLIQQGPEKIVCEIAPSADALGVAGLHLFPFGGFVQSARWMNSVAAGRFTLDDPAGSPGFTID